MIKWFCTDPDSMQFCRVKDYMNGIYEFIEIHDNDDSFAVVMDEINLRDYTYQEAENYFGAYYDSIESLIRAVGWGRAPQIVAECIFESGTYTPIETHNTFNEATKAVQKILTKRNEKWAF